MKKSMKLIAAGLAGVLALGLTACSQNKAAESADGFKPALDTKTECTLNFAGGYSNFEALEQQIDKFRQHYPNVNIVYTALDDYNNVLLTALESSEAPDLFTTKSYMLTNPDTAGVFEYTENLADEKLGFDLDCVRDGLLFKDEDGAVTMVPVLANTYGMLVNEDIFKKNKMEVPTTLSQLTETVDKLKELGYSNPVAGYNSEKGIFEPVTMSYAYLYAAAHPEEAKKINDAAGAGAASIEPIIESTLAFVEKAGIDLSFCTEQIEDNYNALIMRFFQGDIPMAVTVADTASGTKKRESQSEEFSKDPFNYGFYPLPVTDEDVTMFNQAAQCFSVNKNSKNLEMANEFMRFLIRTEPLNEMAATKGLLSVTKERSKSGIYASFNAIDAEHTIDIDAFEFSDVTVNMLRTTACEAANK